MKYILVTFVVVVFAVAAALAYYDFQHFQPSVAKYNKTVPFPEPISRLLDAELGESLKYNVVRELTRDSQTHRASFMHIKYFIWGGFVDLHLSHEKQIRIIVSRAYFGSDCYGFSCAANKFLNKSLLDISAKEAASLVARIRAPNRYSAHPEKLKKRAEELFLRAGYAS